MTKQNKKLNKTVLATIVGTLVFASSSYVAAGESRKYNNHYRQNTTVSYARVVNVEPIVENYQVNNPVEHCWDRKIPQRHYRSKSHTGEILGAIIGGAVGNEFGGGRGKRVATAAGAILGASVARDVKNKKRAYRDDYKVVQQCEYRDSYHTEQRVVAYKVAYKYHGDVFYTQMPQHPGDKIKVKVSVNPV